MGSMKELEIAQVKRPPLDGPEADIAPHASLMPISTYLASECAEVTDRQYMVSPRFTLFAGQTVAKIICGKGVTWEQLREVSVTMSLS